MTEGWGAWWSSHPVVSRSLASVLVLVGQRAASRLDHSLDLCLMAGSHASGGGTRDSRVSSSSFHPRSFPAPCVSAVTSCPQRENSDSFKCPESKQPVLALGTSLSLPECPLRWPLHRPIQVLTRGAHAHACTGVPPPRSWAARRSPTVSSRWVLWGHLLKLLGKRQCRPG